MKKGHPNRLHNQASLFSSIPSPTSPGAETDLSAHVILCCSIPPIPLSGMSLRRKILIVDKPEAAGTIALLCAMLGYQSMTATSIEEALITAQRHNFDLVITDYHIQPDNGLVLISRLRQFGVMTPVIIMTDKPKIAKFMQPTFLNIVKVLIKPLTTATLKLALEESLK